MKVCACCFLGGAIAAVVAGCTTSGPAPKAKQQTDVPVRSAFAAATQAGKVADNWLATFGDPKLNALVDEALKGNPDLRIAAAKREEAAARTMKAGASLVPRIDAGVMGAAAGTGGTGRDQSGLGVQINWEIDVWGRLQRDRSAAEMDQAVVEADYAFARQSLAATTSRAWFIAIANRRQVEIDRSTLAVLEETQRVVKAKLDAGQVRPLDLDLAAANAAEGRSQLEKSKGAYEESLRALEVLLGRYPSAELEVATGLPAVPGSTPAGLPSELLERRPDLVAADRAVAAAFYRVGSAKAAMLPRVTLSASLGTLLNPAEAIWNIGANLLVPVFDGGERKADVQITEARQKQALAAYVKTALNAFAEVETALSNEGILERREREMKAAADRLASAARTAKLRYDSGAPDVTIFDLSQVQRQYFAAQAEHLKVQTERLKQRVNLHLGLGGSFDAGVPVAPAASQP